MEHSVFDRYAIFQAGGKQYQAIEGKTVAIELIKTEPGKTVVFDQVLLRKVQPGDVKIGQPYLDTPVKAIVIKHDKSPKVIVFRFKRRKKVRCKRGHRQPFTVVRIESI
jgi:large subunit ribosomal protein L21